MKQTIFTLAFLAFLSCKQANTVENQETMAELRRYEELTSEEQKTRQFVEDYIQALNATDWKTRLLPFLKPGPAMENFLEEHTKFRESFPNFKSEIKHMVVKGNFCMLWLEETANFVKPFSIESSNYDDEVLNDVPAKNQFLQWTEVWYFNVEDGKFGSEWDFLKDNYAVLEQLKTVQ